MMDDPSTLPVTIGASSLPRPCFADRLATLRREGPMPPWRLLPGGFAETVYARSLVVIKAAQIAEDFKATGIRLVSSGIRRSTGGSGYANGQAAGERMPLSSGVGARRSAGMLT